MSQEQKQIPKKDELNDVIKVFHTTLRQLKLPIPSFIGKYVRYLETNAVNLATELEKVNKKEG
jgi:hypothetical protein